MGEQRECICPHGEASLGKCEGVSMGRGIVRLSTTKGCPEHDSCHGYSASVRAMRRRGDLLWCPVHHTKPCPSQATLTGSSGADRG